MKHRLFYCILSLFAALLLTGCSEDFMSALNGDTKTITFNLQQPSWTGTTRAFTGDDVSTIDIAKLQLLCFDAEGGYTGVATAASISTTNEITATVPKNTNRIHFLYDAGLDVTNVTDGTNEATVLSPNTTVTTNKMACWAYIANLETFQSGDDKTVILKRNVAKVSVTSDDDNTFTATLHAVVGDMDKGSVAPFDFKNTSTPFSSTNYDATTGLPSFVTIPLDATRSTTMTALADGTTEAYLFETQQNTSNTSDSIAVIVKLTYADNTERYHLMRLMDTNSALFDIQRNHHYKITMSSSIPKTLGYSSADKALAGIPTNSYATIENVVDMDKKTTTPSIVLMDASSSTLSSLTVYPALDYSSSGFPVSSTGSVKQKFYFWYKNASEDVAALTANSFTTNTSISGVTVTINSFDTSKKLGTATITVPNSSLKTAGSVCTVTISRTIDDATTYTSSALTVNAAEWGDAFTGTIDYYNYESDGSTPCFTLNDFSLTHTTETSGTNLRIASKYLIPKSSSSTFNNVYIDETPIEGLNYWYNVPEWTSSNLKSLFNQLKYTGSAESDVYVMADGIKASKVTWSGKTTPETTTVVCTFKVENGNAAIVDETGTFSLTGSDKTDVSENTSITIDGITYSCTVSLKMESNTVVTLKLSQSMNLTVYFGSGSTSKNVKVDGTDYAASGSDNYVVIKKLASGEHKITKKDSKVNVALLYLTTAQ